MAIAPPFEIAPLDRDALRTRYRVNRLRTRELFDLVRDALYERPLELRLPFIFYLGHIPAFAYNTLARRALGRPPLHDPFETMFERGIDPGSSQEALSHLRFWPRVAEVHAYTQRVDAAIDELLANERLVDPKNPMLVDGQAVFTLLEHEELHQETLLYIVARLAAAQKTTDGRSTLLDHRPAPQSRRVEVPAGRVTLGAERGTLPFGWDNEFDTIRHDVSAFAVESLPVTNGEYLGFVEDGAPLPAAWLRRDGAWWQRTTLDEIPLQHAWPVYVSHDAATAYARAKGARLMTEAEYHRAAFGDPAGGERSYPWGEAPPTSLHGNLGFRRFEPEGVGGSPLGRSAWGIDELIGNGWELTSTPFAPFPGFVAGASYPQYSSDFFEGAHYVVKGASAVTTSSLIRRSFRNWYRRDYAYAYTKFRLAYS